MITKRQKNETKQQHFVSPHTNNKIFCHRVEGIDGLASSSRVEDKSKAFTTVDYTELQTTRIRGLTQTLPLLKL